MLFYNYGNYGIVAKVGFWNITRPRFEFMVCAKMENL